LPGVYAEGGGARLHDLELEPLVEVAAVDVLVQLWRQHREVAVVVISPAQLGQDRPGHLQRATLPGRTEVEQEPHAPLPVDEIESGVGRGATPSEPGGRWATASAWSSSVSGSVPTDSRPGRSRLIENAPTAQAMSAAIPPRV